MGLLDSFSPYTLQPAVCTLHPLPYTLQSTSHTLHLAHHRFLHTLNRERPPLPINTPSSPKLQHGILEHCNDKNWRKITF